VAYPELVDPTLLDVYPGGPFDPDVVDAASASVRDDAGWHIAPEVTEDVTAEPPYHGGWLLIPSLKVGAINSIVDQDGDAVTGFTLFSAGRLWHPDGWPYLYLTVNLTHGYATVPESLLPVIASRCQRSLVNALLTQRSETVGAKTSSESYNIARLELEARSSGMGRYSLPGRIV